MGGMIGLADDKKSPCSEKQGGGWESLFLMKKTIMKTGERVALWLGGVRCGVGLFLDRQMECGYGFCHVVGDACLFGNHVGRGL